MNDLDVIERHARALMTAHGVGSLTFAFDNSKNRLGAMHSLKIGDVRLPKKITISKHYALILPLDEIHNTVLHEIAHALVPNDGHGYRWKRKAVEIGAKPERCARPSVVPEHSVEAHCNRCGKVFSKGHRLPLRVYFHKGCGTRLDQGVGIWYRDGYRVSLFDMPARYRAEYERIERRQS